jgi:hypothetical protein
MWQAGLVIIVWLTGLSCGHGAAETRAVRDRTVMPGEVDITYHLDGEKLNRISAFRNPTKLESHPELFGEDKEFAPLMTVRAYGPGRLSITGSPATGTLDIPVGTGGERIEIYPHYDLGILSSENELQEDITVRWVEGRNDRSIDSRTLPWSSLGEFFLTPKRFGNLAAIAWLRGRPWKTREDCPKQLEGLSKQGVKYEKPNVAGGWQRIRSWEEMIREKQANCLDLTVWIAGNCAHSGWMSKIYILDNHSMPVFGSEESPLILESTALVESEVAGKARNMEEALKEGEVNFKEDMTRGGTEIDLDHWRPFYQTGRNR